MKLLTDSRTDREAFGKDYEKACRNMAKAYRRWQKKKPSEVANMVIKSAKESIQWPAGYLKREVQTCDPWGHIEFDQAMAWLSVIIARWVENSKDSRGIAPVNMDDHAQEMFVGIAMKVAKEVAGPDFYAPDED